MENVPPSTESDQLARTQSAANASPGSRQLPTRSIPVPATVSARAQALIAAPYPNPQWDAQPASAAEWRAIVARYDAEQLPEIQRTRHSLGVASMAAVVGGVPCHRLTPGDLPVAHRGQVVLAIHGGGFVFKAGESGTMEGILLAAAGGYEVIAVDYRMPPDAPFPAAIDDVMAVYRSLLASHGARNIAVIGSSAGGALTLLLVQRARREGLPVPAVIAPGTPAADLSETGDTYRAHEWLDNVIVSFSGYISTAAALYANGRDLQDPLLSAVYGDFEGFPPTILTSGTRDLFLSSTVRVHRKLRQAGINAQLHLYEGFSHIQYMLDPEADETKEAFGEIAAFFAQHLGA